MANLSELLKEWLPKLTDPEYLANSPVGRFGNVAQSMIMPGIPALAMGLGAVGRTGLGSRVGKELQDVGGAANAMPQLGFMDDLARPLLKADQSMAVAVPATLKEGFFANFDKFEKAVKSSAYRAAGQGYSVDDLTDAGMLKAFSIIEDAPKGAPLHLDPPKFMDWLLDQARTAITQTRGKSVQAADTIADTVAEPYKDIAPIMAQEVAPAAAQAAQQTQRVDRAEDIMSNVLDPTKKLLLDRLGIGLPRTKSEWNDLREIAKLRGIEPPTTKSAKYQLGGDSPVRKLIQQFLPEETKPLEDLSKADLQDRLVNLRKLLPSKDIGSEGSRPRLRPDFDTERILAKMREREIPGDVLAMTRRLLGGKVTPGQNPSDIVRAKGRPEIERQRALDLNRAMDIMFDILKNDK